MKKIFREEWLKENKEIIIVGVIVLGFIFYWFQLRPTMIKKNCSWFTQMEKGAPAVPAFPGVTKEEAERKTAESRARRNCGSANSSDSLDDFFCGSYFAEQPPRPAKPAEPDREVTRAATKAEYDQCLRQSGL